MLQLIHYLLRLTDYTTHPFSCCLNLNSSSPVCVGAEVGSIKQERDFAALAATCLCRQANATTGKLEAQLRIDQGIEAERKGERIV